MAQPMQMINIAIDFLKTNYKFETFQEPRGVMRIFQLVFSVWGFFAARDFTLMVNMECNSDPSRIHYIEYPFGFEESICRNRIGDQKTDNKTYTIDIDPSTGAQFFVMTAVLSLLYALFIIFVYTYLDEMYKSKPEFPMADFALTSGLALFWLIATLAFNSCGNELKKTFDANRLAQMCYNCDPKVSSFTDLNIALMIGFLNFFLWASDLWFLYKETIWFQNRGAIYNQQMYGQQQQPSQQQQQQQQQFNQQYGQQQQYDQQQYGQTSSYETQQYDQYGQQGYGQQQYGQPGM